MLIGQQRTHFFRQALGSAEARLKGELWEANFTTIATDLFLMHTNPPNETDSLRNTSCRMLLHEAPDPNVSRLSFLLAVEAGVYRHDHRMQLCLVCPQPVHTLQKTSLGKRSDR